MALVNPSRIRYKRDEWSNNFTCKPISRTINARKSIWPTRIVFFETNLGRIPTFHSQRLSSESNARKCRLISTPKMSLEILREFLNLQQDFEGHESAGKRAERRRAKIFVFSYPHKRARLEARSRKGRSDFPFVPSNLLISSRPSSPSIGCIQSTRHGWCTSTVKSREQ